MNLRMAVNGEKIANGGNNAIVIGVIAEVSKKKTADANNTLRGNLDTIVE